jgi:aminoglycoside phosphotransferase (APT) family kinase protein
MGDEMLQGLKTYCEQAFPDRLAQQVRGLECISSGWESDVYAFDLESGSDGEQGSPPRREELILRLYQGEQGFHKVKTEFSGMQALFKLGYPVPEALSMQSENEAFGRAFMIMRRVAGVELWPVLFSAPDDLRRARLEQFCGLMVRLHTLDWHPMAPWVSAEQAADPYFFPRRQMEYWQKNLATNLLPGFQPAFAWLADRLPEVACRRPAIVHWDLHPANVLLCADGSMVVIDWTQVAVSDPRFDLAWTLCLVGSHERPHWREVILAEYERQLGQRVEDLEIFDAAACIKRLYSVAFSILAGPEKIGMRPEAVEMMRQQFDSLRGVYALLLERTSIRIRELEDLFS